MDEAERAEEARDDWGQYDDEEYDRDFGQA
jgi:hypothetical protein